MRRTPITIALVASALLLVGSGCDSNDFATATDVLGITKHASDEPPDMKKLAEESSGKSTGDKTEDSILDMADSMEAVKKATALENEAKEALGKRPPDDAAAVTKLREALKERPKDWSLQNQLLIAKAEQGGQDVPALVHPSHLCPENKYGDAEFRCFKAVARERTALIDASVDRQKRNQVLVSCDIQKAAQAHFDFVSRLTEDDLAKLGYTEADRETFIAKSVHAEAAQKTPGVTCRK